MLRFHCDSDRTRATSSMNNTKMHKVDEMIKTRQKYNIQRRKAKRKALSANKVLCAL